MDDSIDANILGLADWFLLKVHPFMDTDKSCEFV